MKIERIGERIFADERGDEYFEVGDGFIDFGSVSRSLLRRQSQYGSEYIDGIIPGRPQLGKGLRFHGDPVIYHSLGIHPDDVGEFVRRFHAFIAYRWGYVTDHPSHEHEGEMYELNESDREVLLKFLEGIGAFENQTG